MFRMVVKDVYTMSGATCFVGDIESGSVVPGDPLFIVSPTRRIRTLVVSFESVAEAGGGSDPATGVVCRGIDHALIDSGYVRNGEFLADRGLLLVSAPPKWWWEFWKS